MLAKYRGIVSHGVINASPSAFPTVFADTIDLHLVHACHKAEPLGNFFLELFDLWLRELNDTPTAFTDNVIVMTLIFL